MRHLNPYFIFLLFVAAIVFFSTSCKKDKNPNKPMLIASSIEINAANPTDTVQQYYFSYDNSNRLIRLINKYATYPASTYNFSYDAAGNMTYYTRSNPGTSNYPQEKFVLIFKNGLPVMQMDTTISSSDPAIQYYSYSNNNNRLIITYNHYDNEMDTLIYNNNNQVYSGLGDTLSTSGTPPDVYLNNSTYTYGSRIGPYASINLKYFITAGIPTVNANEVSAITGKMGHIINTAPEGFLTSSASYTYIYNSAGYPVSGTYKDAASPPGGYITYYGYVTAH